MLKAKRKTNKTKEKKYNTYCSLRCVQWHACVQAHTHKKVYICNLSHAWKNSPFTLCCHYYIFPVRRNFSLKYFLLKIIYRIYNVMNCKILLKYLEKIPCSLVSSIKSLLIITWYWHNSMFTLSQTMYWFEANQNLLANTSTPDVVQYHLEYNLTASCLCCWSTGLTEREIPMQYYTGMEMYANNCTESQVCNDWTYR